MNTYVCFDVEAGGLPEDCSLLTAYFAILDKDFNIVDELDLKLIPDDGIYRVMPQALEVNKIDLKELAKEAITYKEAKTVLYKFLQWNYAEGKLIPLGQAVQFDINFIVDTIISRGAWDSWVSRRVRDTMILANALKDAGRIDVESVSLASLMEYFGVVVEGNAHEARYDALGTAGVYKKMLELLAAPAYTLRFENRA